MVRNFLLTAVRTLLRQRVHALVNIAGLSLGLAVCLLIILYVVNERSYDKFHANADRIYLLPMVWHFGDTDLPTAANCGAGGPFMKETFPEVETYTRFMTARRAFAVDNDFIFEDKLYFADSTFFEVFTFPLLAGDAKHALTQPNSIVLTRTMLKKYFGSMSPDEAIGKSLISDNRKAFAITGIAEDVPANSHLVFNGVMSINTLPASVWEPKWNNSNLGTYLLMRQPVDIADIVSRIPEPLEKAYPGATIDLDLVPFTDVYLRNDKYKAANTSSSTYVNIFSGIALLILVIAIVNYVNLTTSRSLERAREVGVRKVMGALHQQLFRQFLIESMLVVFVSLAIAIAFAWLLSPLFDSLAGKAISVQPLFTLNGLLIAVMAGLFIGGLSGAYPATLLSGYRIVNVLKGKMKNSDAGINMRKGLVVFQFAISIALVICTLALNRQVSYMQNKDLGFDKDQVVSLTLDSLARTRIPALRNALMTLPDVEAVSATTQLPVNITGETAINHGAVFNEESRRLIRWAGADAGFLSALGVKLVTGRDFKFDQKDTTVMLNVSGASFYGWTPEEAIGRELFVWGTPARVSGVVEDFHFNSMKSEIRPLLILPDLFLKGSMGNLLVRTAPTRSNMVGALTTKWKEINPDSPFQMTFLNDRYQLLYDTDVRLGRMVLVFSMLAILIASLGLFGLASYTVIQRTKEMGIRKVLGASVTQLVNMVSIAFIRPVLIAFVLAAPVSYWVILKWLNNFSYKLPFSWLLVVGAGAGTVILAALVVMSHSYQIATTNPAQALKDE
jgi:putative ABC transport system permease protein